MAKFLKKPAFLKIPTFKIPKLTKKRSQSVGLPPGTPVYIGEERAEPVRISCMNFSKDKFDERQDVTVNECKTLANTPEVTWINVDGIYDTQIISSIGDAYGLHPLILEDIVNTQQRPKMEDFGDYIFIVLNMLAYKEEEKEIISEQISLVLGPNFLLTFQERPGDIFEGVRNRIRSGKGRIRTLGNDYLAYALIDSIVDNYFVILEKVGESIESIEENLMEKPDPDTLQQIYYLKREMIFLRKSVWPIREIVNGLEKTETSLITKETSRYIRDVYDHTIQVIDMVETYRDMLSGMLDLYLSSISHRMNEVMKVLTIIATIFIPMTFIAGVYGMNFSPDAGPFSMPELGWPYGYAISWVVMITIAVAMLIFFRKRKWL